MALTDAQIQEAIPHLGIGQTDFQAIQRLGTHALRVEALEDLKKRAHKNFKKAARELHPDINGGDDRKTATFQTLVQLLAELDKLQVRPPQPQYTMGYSSSTSTSTGGSSYGNTVTIRITYG